MVAFRSWVAGEKDINGKLSSYLNVGKVNSSQKGISNFKKIIISGEIAGQLKFDDENNVSIVEEKFIYKLKDGKLIKVANTLTKKKELTALQLNEFRQSLAKQFPKEVISDQTVLEDIDIYNIVAF